MRVTLEELTKEFQSQKNGEKVIVRAVDDLSFEIEDGKLVCLLGPSGCGKSTLLNLICGLEKPTAGRIYFDGTDVTGLPPENRGVGMVFQNYALYPHLSVRDNILFPLQNLRGKDKLTKGEMLKRAEAAAKLVQVSELMERKPANMSGGQQQRVAIARALVKKPRILLLDEPLSNLDARLRLQMREEIRRIQRETGITTVFVTHDQEEALSISDSIVLMKEGAIHQIGKPQEVYDNPVNLFVAKFLGTPPINIFSGRIAGGKLFIGEDCVLAVRGPQDGEVTVGVRPEGFIPKADGPLVCEFRSLEVMGRDTSVVAAHPAAAEPILRAIVSAEADTSPRDGAIRFALKPYKVFLFKPDTGERIAFEAV